ncbi:MAG: HAMP domain-containing sensor histidine kinase [Acidimicrobiia bacterium]
MTTSLERPRLGGKRRFRVRRAIVLVSAAGTFAAGAGLLFSGQYDRQPNAMMFGVLVFAVAGWCLWQLWTDHLQPVVTMAVVAASIGVMGLFTDPGFQLAVSSILILYAGVGAVLIPDTRRFWAFTLFVGAAGGYTFIAHRLGLGLTNEDDAAFSHFIVLGIVFWTAAGIFRTVRDEIVTQQQIHQSKDRFLARVGHELRTLLTAVVGYADLILEDETTPDKIREWVDVIAHESDEMSAIIDGFTVVARATDQLLTLKPTTFLIVPEIHKMLSRIHARDINPRVTGSADIYVHADRDRLSQVLRVLTTNALEHARETVHVAVGSDADTTWIDVIDDGPGLSQGNKYIFEASWEPQSELGQPEHLGRGLFVALVLTHAMNFDLSYSRREDRTVFRLLTPPGLVPVQAR